MNYEMRRQKVYDKMEEHSVLILFSGIESHVSADEYAPFEANRNFFYLTGLRRERMILVMDQSGEKRKTTLYIPAFDSDAVRWTGKMVTVDEAKEISGIDDVVYADVFESRIGGIMTREIVNTLYFDCYRHQTEDLPDYNAVRAREFGEKYPGVAVRNIFPVIAGLRTQKDEDEVALIRKAISITDRALQNVMSHLKPGMKEYQAQADFEYTVHYLGADGTSFPTIAGSGANGTMLHYETNRDTCEDGTLLLLDLGAKYQGYCADITRTYPVNGVFTPRQREVYEVVLAANRAVAAAARPGVTLGGLNEICKQVLAEGCMKLGLIDSPEKIGTYYMHGVSHHLGIDVHDVSARRDEPLKPGAVITDEPGLYIDEWGIGIRIEDDLLIGEDGCEVLSADVIREADEIEAFMAQAKRF